MCKIYLNLQSTKFLAIFLISFFLINISVFDQPLEIKLKASDGTEYDFFGNSVAISGNLAIAGAIGDNDNDRDLDFFVANFAVPCGEQNNFSEHLTYI